MARDSTTKSSERRSRDSNGIVRGEDSVAVGFREGG